MTAFDQDNPIAQLGAQHFADQEVLENARAVEQRLQALHYGMVLGNNYSRLVRLCLATKAGDKELETNIWAIAGDRVKLKGGTHIPIHAIKSVQIL